MKKIKYDYCRIKDNVMLCEHCGETLEIPFPIRVSIFCAMSKAFIEAHKYCKPRDDGNQAN